MDWFKIGKGVCQSLSPCLCNLYAESITRNGMPNDSQVEIKIDEKSINNLRRMDDATVMAESEEELTILLMRVKEESARASLRLSIKKTKIMASHPYCCMANRWANNGNSDRLHFLGLQYHCRW